MDQEKDKQIGLFFFQNKNESDEINNNLNFKNIEKT